MRAIIAAIILGLSAGAYAEPEKKKVCVTEVDAKTKKQKEVCKTIKVHKKLDGTKVPEKK